MSFFCVHGEWIGVPKKWIECSRSGSQTICSAIRFIPHEHRKKIILIPYIYNASNKDPFKISPRKVIHYSPVTDTHVISRQMHKMIRISTMWIISYTTCKRLWCHSLISRNVRFRSPVLRGIWINASAHKTWRHLYFFLICFPYQVIYQKTRQILGFLNIHELGISWNTNLNKMGRIHDIWDNLWPQNVLF